MMAPSVVVITQIPAPYQVELFDAVAASGFVRLKVIYLLRRHGTRQWECALPAHEHLVYEECVTAVATARNWIAEADLAVFAWYSDGAARDLIRVRAASGVRWCL